MFFSNSMYIQSHHSIWQKSSLIRQRLGRSQVAQDTLSWQYFATASCHSQQGSIASALRYIPLILICITFAELVGSWRLGRLKKERHNRICFMNQCHIYSRQYEKGMIEIDGKVKRDFSNISTKIQI